jgi:hypothetical protein
MHIEMLKDKKKRIINCLNWNGKGCKNNFTSMCNGCKIFTGHADKPNLYEE